MANVYWTELEKLTLQAVYNAALGSHVLARPEAERRLPNRAWKAIRQKAYELALVSDRRPMTDAEESRYFRVAHRGDRPLRCECGGRAFCPNQDGDLLCFNCGRYGRVPHAS